MGALGAEGVHRRQIEMLEYLQKQDRRGPLAVRRMLQQSMAPVVAADRLAIGATRRGQIVQRVAAAKGLQRGDHVLGHLALVKPRPALGSHPAQHLRLTGGAEDLACDRHLAVQQVEFPRVALQSSGVVGPVKGHPGGDRHAFVGIVDRRGQNLSRPSRPSRRQGTKRVNRTWQGDGVDPAQGHGRHLPLAQRFGSGGSRGTARSVQRKDIIRSGGLDQHETIAADPRHLRLANPQQNRTRNGRIDGISARLQDTDCSFGRQRMGRRAHPVGRIGGRAARHVKIAHASTPLQRKILRDRAGYSKGVRGGVPRRRGLGGGYDPQRRGKLYAATSSV